MKKLAFFTVPNEYVEFLQKKEKEVRGFSRVPNLEYGKQRHKKFLCGIVLTINNINYFAPVTSYKIQKPDNFLIRDKKGNVLSSLRFNYMIPVPIIIIKLLDFKQETDLKYRNLLEIELRYCQKNQEQILRLAERTYKRVLLGKNIGLVNNSCSFKLLEEKYEEFIQTRLPKSTLDIYLSLDMQKHHPYLYLLNKELQDLD